MSSASVYCITSKLRFWETSDLDVVIRQVNQIYYVFFLLAGAQGYLQQEYCLFRVSVPAKIFLLLLSVWRSRLGLWLCLLLGLGDRSLLLWGGPKKHVLPALFPFVKMQNGGCQ